MKWLSKLHANIYFLLPVSFFLGLFLPYVDQIGVWSLKILIFAVIFLSCFKVEQKEIQRKFFLQSIYFWLIRFIIFPIAVFFLADYFLPDYSVAVLILSLAPAGVSSVAFANIFRGNVSLSFFVLILSSLACPFSYSLLSGLLFKKVIEVNAIKMFIDLLIIVFLPILLHLPFRKLQVSTAKIKQHGSAIVVYLISLLLLFAVAMQRDAFILDQDFLIICLILFVLFILYYSFYFILPGSSKADRITYAISSGANNNALAITISALFFGATELKFNVLSEIIWFISVMIFKSIHHLFELPSTQKN